VFGWEELLVSLEARAAFLRHQANLIPRSYVVWSRYWRRVGAGPAPASQPLSDDAALRVRRIKGVDDEVWHAFESKRLSEHQSLCAVPQRCRKDRNHDRDAYCNREAADD